LIRRRRRSYRPASSFARKQATCDYHASIFTAAVSSLQRWSDCGSPKKRFADPQGAAREIHRLGRLGGLLTPS
jgi:hypothetical protein